MIFISHRGNLHGKNTEFENNPLYISEALINGFQVEIDVWYNQGELFLGHDFPQHKINLNFLKDTNLWCHCKNSEAFEFLHTNKNIHSFWHQNDDYTLTSNGYIWCYPNKKPLKNSVVLNFEEKLLIDNNDIKIIYGICSDYIISVKNQIYNL